MSQKATVMTAVKINEFKRAFSMGFTKAEAILYCDVAERTFFDYCSKNPKFTELIPTLQNMPKLKAKMNVLNSIENNDAEYTKQKMDDSKWYLERKAKDEFSLRTENKTELSGTLSIWNVLNELWDSNIDLTK